VFLTSDSPCEPLDLYCFAVMERVSNIVSRVLKRTRAKSLAGCSSHYARLADL
jgi:hypothetical protein